jgi:prepilin-type N-terminal cleavage/methylation domain-containing protein
MTKRNGFTLVEILIVVVILGILAAIVIPQFSDASEEAKLSSLVSDLQSIRSQIQLYKVQHSHGDSLNIPGTVSGVDFEAAMTTYTIANGTSATTQAPDPNGGVYGPYLQKIPTNPFNDSDTVTSGTTTPAPGTGGTTSGWYFNTDTGAFNANDSVPHAAL